MLPGFLASITGGTGKKVDVGDNIAQSAIFDGAESSRLTRTPSAGNRTTWTYSTWFKRHELTFISFLCARDPNGLQPFSSLSIDGNNNIVFNESDGSVYTTQKISTALYRDVGEWYHIMFVWDTTNGTDEDKARVYLNGVRVTDWATNNPPSASEQSQVNNIYPHAIGANIGLATSYDNHADVTFAELHFVDGQALDPTDFGRFNDQGRWVPKTYAGTHGTNGYYLAFQDNTSFGDDTSANTNDWTQANFATDHQVTDTPTNNYCTMNVLANAQGAQISDGALQIDTQISSGDKHIFANMLLPETGKWYWETTYDVIETTNGRAALYISDALHEDAGITGRNYAGFVGHSLGVQSNGTVNTADLGVNSNGNTICWAYDADNNQLFLANNTNVNTGATAAVTGMTASSGYRLSCVEASSTNGATITVNFGQRAFAHTVPAGYKQLCTRDLPEPAILDPRDYFNVVTWTGDNTTNRAITGVGFQPDKVAVKNRDDTFGARVHDAVRGAGVELNWASTDAEGIADNSLYGDLNSFDVDGFTVSRGASDADDDSYNQGASPTAQDYVAWCWKEGAIPGFDIVSYSGNATGRTIAHSLGVAPELIIIKGRNPTAAENWIVGSIKLSSGWDNQLLLNGAGAESASANFNNTAPTSSVFSIGSGTAVNENTKDYIAYLFASVPGYSKAFSYSSPATAVADGPFIPLDFQARWVLLKHTNGADNWVLLDTERDPDNVSGAFLNPNLSNSEGSGTVLDIVSNGIKIRGVSSSYNGNSGQYIGVAFAEHPFKYARAR